MANTWGKQLCVDKFGTISQKIVSSVNCNVQYFFKTVIALHFASVQSYKKSAKILLLYFVLKST